MAKLILALLVAGAFLYALGIVLSRGALPDPARHAGWRRRFVLATILFAGLLGHAACQSAQPLCYDMPPPDVTGDPDRQVDRAMTPAATLQAVVPTLRVVWLALDPARGEEFRKQIEPLVAQGRLREPEGRILALAYAGIALHQHQKETADRGLQPVVVCYKLTALGGAIRSSRDKALRQVVLLREAARKGTIDAETAEKAGATLARELEMLSLSDDMQSRPWTHQEKLIQEYEKGLLETSGPATAAAALIVGLEGGPMPDAGTPPGRP